MKILILPIVGLPLCAAPLVKAQATSYQLISDENENLGFVTVKQACGLFAEGVEIERLEPLDARKRTALFERLRQSQL